MTTGNADFMGSAMFIDSGEEGREARRVEALKGYSGGNDDAGMDPKAVT